MMVIGCLFTNGLNQIDHKADVARCHRFQQFDYLLLWGYPKNLSNALGENTTFAEGYCLVGERQRVAHTPRSSHGYLPEGIAFSLYVFFNQDLAYVFRYPRRSQVLEIKLQAARENGDGQFLRVCRGEQKFYVLGRLF